MSSDFVHLHVHTEFSLLDGQSQIKNLVKRAQELEMSALGITDHGVMFGAIDFYRACMDADITPVVGMEAYLAPRKMTDKDPRLDKRPYHMLLLAKNMTGYQNLLKMASAAQLDGYYYRPRIDKEFMAQHAEGVIATSGCLAAEIPRMVENGDDSAARELVGWYQDVFGEDNFYLELQNHNIAELDVLNKWIYDYRKSNHTKIQLLATNDVHYVRKDDWDAHDTLLCIQTGALKSEDNRMRMSPQDSYYLKSSEEMRAEFGNAPKEMIDEAFANSLKIAEMTDIDLSPKGYHLPIFPTPEPHTEASYLRYLVEMGMVWRFNENWRDDKVLNERIERELDIIHTMGFDTYFLIVWDLCEFARHADIWWNVRGSGAGSLVAYSLGITSIDPIQNSLLFERFLNPGRVSMPDIDLDYPDDRRGEMIAYTAKKYGEDKVAAIITFGTMGAKAAVRDVGRALNVDLAKINKAVALIPQEARQKKIREYVDMNPELTQLYESDAELKRVINTAIELQGMTRHASTHAAGVIVSDRPLVDYIPLHRITGKDPSGGALKAVTQFPMETSESIGLLKVDFLGLSTLTILRKACELIERHQGINYTMETIPYRHDSPITDEQRGMLDEAFRMMGRGDTVGVFQVESGGMQQMLRGMRPKIFENIIAGISLYRPGPMEFIPTYNDRLHGEEEVEYLHPQLESILGETYGIITYQEQIMQIAGEMFDYELGEADLMRRAVSKKKAKALLEHKAIFMERGPDNGIPEETAEEIFDMIEFFANYGFNKCLVGETEIIDAETGQRVQIGDLYEGKAKVEKTLSLNTYTLCLEERKIVDVMANGVKPVFELVTQLGYSIEATGNHPFFTKEGWKNLEDLSEGEFIAVQRQMASDIHDLPQVKIHEIIEQISNDAIVFIPDEIFKLSESSLKTFLSLLWNQLSSDDSVSRTHIIQHNSETLLRQIQSLLLKCGFASSVGKIMDPIDGASDDLVSLGILHEQVLEFAEVFLTNWRDEILVQYGSECLKSYEESLHYDLITKADYQNGLNSTRFEGNIFWDKVGEIWKRGEKPTYDLTIEGTHNFVANDIIVHNSHASDYAVITVQTAYLKCHYPEEYMTALLIVQRDDSTKVATFLEECRRLDIPVLPPDVNYSQLDFDIETLADGKRGIRFGLAAVKNAGVSALEGLIEQRGGEPFESLQDFCQRVDLRKVGKRTLESLIKVGALVKFGTRSTLLAAMERIISYSGNYHKDKEIGQMNMFGDSVGVDDGLLQNLPNLEEYKNREMLKWEKELLGLYVTGRPVDRHKHIFQTRNLHKVIDLKDPNTHKPEQVAVAGELTAVRKITTKNNDMMAILTLEDWHDSAGSIDVVLFPRTYNRVMSYFDEKNEGIYEDKDKKGLFEGEIVAITGNYDDSRGDPQIIADDVSIDFNMISAVGETPYFDDATPVWAMEGNDSNLPPDDAPPMEFDEETGEIKNTSSHIQPPMEVDVVVTAPPIVKNGQVNGLNGNHDHNGHNGVNGNGHHADNSHNGYDTANGNGYHTERREDESEPEWVSDDEMLVLPSEAMEDDRPPRTIYVYLSASNDANKDRRKLNKLHGRLIQFPGKDHFKIIINRPRQPLVFKFPNHTTDICDALYEDLIEIVGSMDNIKVEDDM